MGKGIRLRKERRAGREQRIIDYEKIRSELANSSWDYPTQKKNAEMLWEKALNVQK